MNTANAVRQKWMVFLHNFYDVLLNFREEVQTLREICLEFL